MKFAIATIAVLAATAAAMGRRQNDECCAEVQAEAFLGTKCAGLALLDFTTLVDGQCYEFYKKGSDSYYTAATCEAGVYTANIWVNDDACTPDAGVYPLEQGLECSTSEVTDGMSAALELSCIDA
ncbi:hypothetical protein SARC_07865 [Sphaeroforma arctica JP610]|uniref:Cyanovirin-N domain-containing protein n=1 Tax=Sphaeroforma arctica JP610 TaxID=667725 RepID=A0A0L0FUY7_9EUKA|nr:hypothetical protein SARC_07865 [Sphaeroforma arctica JP610]KNC79753.1 hypothetical protein SARC_07865 [Sphaeroforma arctica JP610]|eukprot:XP_014153655.1 hypothetical protein SARC_07865 [Sphaeroforma arctica JP610]